VIVAGRNFGCGSAMEIAVTVIQAAGIQAVAARSFARSFFRNAINNGLLVIECDTRHFQEGDRMSIEVSDAAVRVHHLTPSLRWPASRRKCEIGEGVDSQRMRRRLRSLGARQTPLRAIWDFGETNFDGRRERSPA
jgi:3-isopropylmalate dehydratase small subunit